MDSGTFSQVLSLHGAEIAAATTFGTAKCPTCQCLKSELANKEETWQLRTVRELNQAVEDAKAEHLNADGTVKEGLKTKPARPCRHKDITRYMTCYITCYMTWSCAGRRGREEAET